jgi:hypothetical protein
MDLRNVKNKFDFNKLDLEKQVLFFNRKLEKGFKISEICFNLGISYNTIRERFGRYNYKYNKLSRQYECIEKTFNYDNEVVEKALEKIVTKVFNSKNKDEETKHFKCEVSGKVINRSFRVYDTVLEDFTKFCKKCNYNQYDILSEFIKEGIEKYSDAI